MSLTISRKAGESIEVGDVVVNVLRIRGERVSINIEAPKEVLILRSELLNKKDSSNGKEEATDK